MRARVGAAPCEPWCNVGMDLKVSVQASPRDRASWLALARRVEEAGLHGLYAADHPGSTSSPFVALAAAAAVTERLQLGTCVVNAGTWEPLALASEAATLDVVSGGRALLGVGAGHTPQEWTSAGRAFPSASDRVHRMVEMVDAVARLLDGGTVSVSGTHVELVEAELADPRPVQEPLPLLVGGNGARVLRFAAERADVVGITGTGRTLEDGHSHEVDWSEAATAATVEAVLDAARRAGRDPEIEALVQVVQVTDDADGAVASLLDHLPSATAEDLLTAPSVWIGTLDEIRDKLRRCRQDLSISRYVIRPPAMDDALRVLDLPPG